jgi:hypothetical protein
MMVAGVSTKFVEFLDQALMPITKDLDNRGTVTRAGMSLIDGGKAFT